MRTIPSNPKEEAVGMKQKPQNTFSCYNRFPITRKFLSITVII